MNDPKPHEPVLYSYGQKCAMPGEWGGRPWAFDEDFCRWVTNKFTAGKTNPVSVRLANGQLVIIRPRSPK